MKALETGVATLFSGDATLTGLIGSQVYRDPAPEQATHPLLVFRARRAKVDTLGTDNGYFRALLTVKAIDETEDQTTASDAFERAEWLLINGNVVVTGYAVMGVTRNGEQFSYPEHDGDRHYQHVGGEFAVLLQAA